MPSALPRSPVHDVTQWCPASANSRSQGVFVLPAYAVLNASLFYEYAKFRFAIKSDNLTNQHYWIGYSTVNPQRLRSVIASVAIKF